MNLYSAIATNYPDYVREKLNADKDLINQTDHFGRPPLYYAIGRQDPRMCRLLLMYRPRLDIRDRFGLNCLDYARYYDSVCGSRFEECLTKYDPRFCENHFNRFQTKKEWFKFWDDVRTTYRSDFVLFNYESSDSD